MGMSGIEQYIRLYTTPPANCCKIRYPSTGCHHGQGGGEFDSCHIPKVTTEHHLTAVREDGIDYHRTRTSMSSPSSWIGAEYWTW